MDYFKELWELARTAGPFATLLLLYLLYDERKDRKKAQQDTTTIAIGTIKASHAVEASLQALGAKRRRQRKTAGRDRGP